MPEHKIPPRSRTDQMVYQMTLDGVSRSCMIDHLECEAGVVVSKSTVRRAQKRMGVI